MRRTLHITNGDSAVSVMREAELVGDFLPWRDVLHEGPVPGGLSLEELSRLRAAFITGRGWGSKQRVLASLRERDDLIGRFRDCDELVLWFEHDLYDQLQLVQILDWLANRDWGETEISLIGTDHYLGLMSAAELSTWIGRQRPVTTRQLDLAKRAWSAFCSDTPQAWQSMLAHDTSPLPRLGSAIERLLEEYPSSDGGVSRSERQALAAVAESAATPAALFGRSQRAEQARFMGDTQFNDRLRAMTRCWPPLLRCAPGGDGSLSITDAGREVLHGERDWLASIELDRWIGGVHLTNASHWRWNPHDQRLEYPV